MSLRHVLRDHLVDLSLAIGLQPHFDPLQYSAPLHEYVKPPVLPGLAHDAPEFFDVATVEPLTVHDHDAVTFAQPSALRGTLGRDGGDTQTGMELLDPCSEVAATGSHRTDGALAFRCRSIAYLGR